MCQGSVRIGYVAHYNKMYIHVVHGIGGYTVHLHMNTNIFSVRAQIAQRSRIDSITSIKYFKCYVIVTQRLMTIFGTYKYVVDVLTNRYNK